MAPTAVIGYETSEQLDVEPAKYFVRVTKREKRACRDCEEQGVQSAPLPAWIIDKGLASDRVVIDTVVSKYADHVPLYRQSAILERETGIELSRATLDGWVMRVGELLSPIAAAMGQELLKGDYIQADETPVDVQMHDGRRKNHQAYLWQYSSPEGPVVFDFRKSLLCKIMMLAVNGLKGARGAPSESDEMEKVIFSKVIGGESVFLWITSKVI